MKNMMFFNRLTLHMTKVVLFLLHRPLHSELRLTRSLGELLLQPFSAGLKFRMPYGIRQFRLLTSLYLEYSHWHLNLCHVLHDSMGIPIP